MKLKLAILFLICVAPSINNWSQSRKITIGDTEYLCGVQGRNGAIALVGRGQSLDKRASAPLFFELQDSTSNKIYQSRVPLGRGRIDRIIATFDGGYLLAGQSQGGQINPENKQEMTQSIGQDAWICKLDWAGKLLWHRFFGGNVAEAFYDVIQVDDGSYFAVGDSSGYHFAKRFYGQKDAAQTPKGFKVKAGELRSVCIGEQNAIVYAGQELVQGQKKACVYALSIQGIEKKLVATDLKNSDILIRICYDEGTKGYGLVSDKFFYFFRKVGAQYRPSEISFSSEFKYPEIKDLIALQNNEFVLVGNCNGIGKLDGMLIHLDGKLQIKNKTQENPSGDVDQFSGVCQLANGRIWALGASKGTSWKYDQLLIPAVATIPKSAYKGVLDHQFWDENNNDILNAGEYDYLHFQLENQDSVDWHNLRLKTSGLDVFVGLQSWSDLYLGHLAKGSTRSFSLPLPGALNLNTYSSLILLSITTASGQVIDTFYYRLKTEALPSPDLVIHGDSTSFILPNNNGNLPQRGQPITLRLAIFNKGKARADTAYVRFFHPYKIRTIDRTTGNVSGKDIELKLEKVYLKNRAGAADTIGVGEIKYLYYTFQAMSYFEYDSIPIHAVVYSNLGRNYHDTTIGVKILNFFAVPKNGVYEIPIWERERRKQRGPSAPEDPKVLADVITWEAPKANEFAGKRSLEYHLPTIPCSIRVELTLKPDSTNFQIIINNNIYNVSNQAFKELISDFKIEAHDLGYSIFFNLHLKLGLNNAQVKIGDKKSQIMVIERTSYKKDLFFLGIGIDYSKLDTCGFDKLNCVKKDIVDLYNLFLSQKGKYYKELKRVMIDTSYESTTYISVKTHIAEFSELFKEVENFNGSHPYDPGKGLGDEIRIFISGHGKISAKDFEIKFSNYDCKHGLYQENFLRYFLDKSILPNALIFVNTCLMSKSKLDTPSLQPNIIGNKAIIFSNKPGLLSFEPKSSNSNCNSNFGGAIVEIYKFFLVNFGNGTVRLDQFFDKLKEEMAHLEGPKQTPHLERGSLPLDSVIFITH